MPAPPTITIRRQILDVEVHGTEADGASVQRRLSRLCADVLSPALESALTPIDDPDAHLSVERLAIDLSGIALDQLDAELADAVRREVADHFRRNPPMRLGAIDARDALDGQRRTVAETIDDALVTFLRTGQLPWSFRVPSGSHLEALVLEAWGGTDADRRPPAATRARLSEVLTLEHARVRLIRQFTPGFVAIVLRSLSAPLAAAAEEVIAALDHGRDLDAHPGPAVARSVRAAALAAASAGHQPTPAELARSAWLHLTPGQRDSRGLADALEQRWPGVTNVAIPGPVRDTTEASRPLRSSQPAAVADDADGMLVDHAGIVLLHPFLPRLFEGLGLARDRELLEPDRALCLLHHLATGELTAPEHQLTLAKVLCGVPLDEPVEADVGLTEAETEEAAAVLDATITHWEALRDTSPDALRAEFLRRRGMLTVDADGGCLLRVEARTVDVLLDRLPWTVSLLELPWMDRLLRVEWR